MSKKTEAFILFGSGKKPSDPEVKALGLKSKTYYSYYQEFKKTQMKAQSYSITDDEISQLKQEKVILTLTNQIAELKAEKDKLPGRVGKLEKKIDAIIDYLKEEHETVLSRLDTHAYLSGILGEAIDWGGYSKNNTQITQGVEVACEDSKQRSQVDNKKLDTIKEGIAW